MDLLTVYPLASFFGPLSQIFTSNVKLSQMPPLARGYHTGPCVCSSEFTSTLKTWISTKVLLSHNFLNLISKELITPILNAQETNLNVKSTLTLP